MANGLGFASCCTPLSGNTDVTRETERGNGLNHEPRATPPRAAGVAVTYFAVYPRGLRLRRPRPPQFRLIRFDLFVFGKSDPFVT